MPNQAPLVFIAGHGFLSGKKKVIDIGKYHVILPVGEGKALLLWA